MAVGAQMRQLVQEYVCKVEDTWGVHFKEGRTPGLRFMAHLWEDLRYMWKPLAVWPSFWLTCEATAVDSQLKTGNVAANKVKASLALWR